MRSKWKGYYCSIELKNKLINNNNNNIIQIYERNSTILPEFVNKSVKIHNGKEFKLLNIKNEHIGYKFGEFAITKKSPKYPIKKKTNK